MHWLCYDFSRRENPEVHRNALKLFCLTPDNANLSIDENRLQVTCCNYFLVVKYFAHGLHRKAVGIETQEKEDSRPQETWPEPKRNIGTDRMLKAVCGTGLERSEYIRKR